MSTSLLVAIGAGIAVLTGIGAGIGYSCAGDYRYGGPGDFCQ